MIRFLSSSLLVLGLITAVPALAQETQVFDFDFDQQSDGTLVTPPPDTSREPITAPLRPTDKATTGQDSSTAPLPPVVSTPVKSESPTATPVTKDKDGVIVVIGEPDPPAAQNQPLNEEELYNLFAAPEPEEVTLTPNGLPPTTSVPASPGEARVEKSKADQPAASKAQKKSTSKSASSKKDAKSPGEAPAKIAKPAVPAKRSSVDDILVKRGDLYYHRWYLASKAWSRVGASVSPKTVSLTPNRPLYPIDRGVLPTVAPAAGGRVFTDRHSGWAGTTVVEITEFP